MAGSTSPARAQVDSPTRPGDARASDANSPSPRIRQPTTSSTSSSSSPLRRFSLLRRSKDSPSNKRTSLSQVETSSPSRTSSSAAPSSSSPRASTSAEPSSPTRQGRANGTYTGDHGEQVLSESPANMSEGHLMASLVAEEEAEAEAARRDRPSLEVHTGVPSILVSPSSPIQPPEGPMRATKDRPRRTSKYSDEDDQDQHSPTATTAPPADTKSAPSPANRPPSTKSRPLDKTDPQPPTSWLKRIGLDSGPAQPAPRGGATTADPSSAGPASPSLFSLSSLSMPSMPSMSNFSIPTLSSLVPKLPPTTSFPVFEEVTDDEDEDAPPSPDAGTDGSHKPQRARRSTARTMSGSAVFEGEGDAPRDLHLDEADENGRSFTHKAAHKPRHVHSAHHLRHASGDAAGARKASGSSPKSHSRVNPLEHAIASAAPNSTRQAELEAADRRWAAGTQGPNGGAGGARPGLGRKQSITQIGKALMGSPGVASELGPVPSSSSGGSSPAEAKPSGMVGAAESSPRKARFSLLSTMRRKKNGNVPRPLSLTSVPDSPAASLPPNSPGGASSIIGSPDRAKGREGRDKVKLAKVRVSGKKHRELDHLFIAQELNFASSLPPKASPPLHDAASAMSGAPSHADGPKPVWVTKWSPDGRLFAAGGHGGVVRVWKVLSTEEDRAGQDGGVMAVFEPTPMIEWRSHEADVLDMCWSKNSNFLLTSSMDSSVRLFHVERAECLCAFQHLALVTSIAFCPVNDKYFVSGSMDKVLRLWGVVERSVIRSTFLPEMITSVGFTQDGQQVIAGSFTGEVRFFDVSSFKFNTQFLAASTRGQNASGHKITSIVPFPLPSTGGERILISSNGKSARIRLFHVEDKLEEVKFGGHENSSSQIRADWSDDGRYVISGSESGEVVVWDSGLVPQAGGKGWLAMKKSKTGPPYEHWHVPDASVVTCASFAPSITREVLARSGDPVFDDGRDHLAPLERTLSGASLSVISSVPTRLVGADPEEHVPNAAKDAIIVAADSETGVLKVYRNSRLGGGGVGSGLTRKQQNRMSAGSGWSGR